MSDCYRPTKQGLWKGLAPITSHFAPFYGAVALGNSTQYRMGVLKTVKGLFIGIEGRGAYEFQSFAHKSYVQQKLNLEFEGDAANVADLVNYLLGIHDEKTLPQGRYDEKLCDLEEADGETGPLMT